MRTYARAAAIASALLATAFAALVHLTPAAASPGRQGGAATPSKCTIATDKVAVPTNVNLGETVDIVLSMRQTCPMTAPLNIVLVMDGSGSMAGGPSRTMKDAMKKLVDGLDLPRHPEVKVGVVQFGDGALVLCQLTNTAAQVSSCIGRVPASGDSCIDCGIKEGLRVMLQDRRKRVPAGGITEVMVVMSDGSNLAGCDPVLQAARQVKPQGIVLITVCLGPGCDAPCMLGAASSARYFFAVGSSTDTVGMNAVVQSVLRAFTLPILRRATVSDTLTPNLRFVPDSAQPPPARVDSDRGPIVWETSYVAADGMTLTFKALPLQVGTYPTNVEAKGTFVDALGNTGVFTFPIPSIVVGTGAVRTPTATSNVPTPVRPTSVPATPVPTASPPINVCPGLDRLVPRSVIDGAVANPQQVQGWDQLCSPNQPPGPFNVRRVWLGLQHVSQPFSPLFNSVVLRCGCR